MDKDKHNFSNKTNFLLKNDKKTLKTNIFNVC
jgi:hypothetical protein